MDARIICIEILKILSDRHPGEVPTWLLYRDIGASKRSIQRQIKFLFEHGFVERKPCYKLKLVELKNNA